MANRWEIPPEIELRLRRKFKACAYCGRKMKTYPRAIGFVRDKATIEHLNRDGPFYWSKRLKEKHLVIACAECNCSRGKKKLKHWFQSEYCLAKQINPKTVAPAVRRYLQTPAANR